MNDFLIIYSIIITILWGVGLGQRHTRRTLNELLEKEVKALKPTVTGLAGAVSHMNPQHFVDLFTLDALDKDMEVVLQTLQAMSKNLITILDAIRDQGTQTTKGIATYITNLKYARDHYAKTDIQKRTLNKIISSIEAHASTTEQTSSH